MRIERKTTPQMQRPAEVKPLQKHSVQKTLPKKMQSLAKKVEAIAAFRYHTVKLAKKLPAMSKQRVLKDASAVFQRTARKAKSAH